MVQIPSLNCGRKKGLGGDSVKLIPYILCGVRARLGNWADAS